MASSLEFFQWNSKHFFHVTFVLGLIIASTISSQPPGQNSHNLLLGKTFSSDLNPDSETFDSGFVNVYSDATDLKSNEARKSGASSPPFSPLTSRLPTNLVPSKYFLKIQPILEPSNEFLQWTAPGEVTISFSVVQNTEVIVLHAGNISILQSNVKLTAAGSEEMLGLKSHHQNEKYQTYTITTAKGMMKGENYELTIPFVATLLNKNVGLYGFLYPDPDASPSKEPRMRRAAASQFQPFHARQAFPCFDEPQLKAEFEMSIGRLESYQSFSNTKIAASMPDIVSKGWVWDTYENTPPMSTNVVNIVVVDDYTNEVADPAINPKTKIQVWAPKTLIEQNTAKYSANQTAHIFKFFEDYFGVPYPLDKLDSVLVWQTDGPAMEHLGSITYGLGGASLLYLPEMTPEWKRLSIVSLLAHEVLHQWMGNLVSVDWWSDIWLHEGFADYFADLAVGSIQPEFQSTVLFLNSHFQRSMRSDQSERSHPVKFIPKNKSGDEDDDDDDDYSDMGSFDDLEYSKGASLVRMMNLILTEPVFKDGLRVFLKQFSYKAVNQDNLFDAMNSVIPEKILPPGTTLKQIMDTWTLQAGYPVVTVVPLSPDTIQLKQEKFKAGKPESENHTHWWIPIKVVTADNPMTTATPQLWLSSSNHELKYSDKIDTSKWLIVNPDATGYFRVLYDLSIQDKIKGQLDKDHTVFSATTRSQLLDDYFTFADLDYVPIEEALELTTYLGKEKELVVWDVVFTHLSTAINMFSSNAEFDGLQKYLIPKIDAVLTSPEVNLQEQMENDKGAVVLFRMELLKYGCMLQSPACHKYVSQVMNTWMTMQQTNPIPLDFQPTLYCAGVAAGNKTVWDFMKGMHDQMPPSEHRMILFKALTCSQDPAVLALLLEEGWLRENMMNPTQVLEAMADNPIGKMLVFEYLKTNFAKMMPVNFVRILNMLSEYWVDPEQISDLENFVKANPEFFASEMEEMKDEIENHKENAAWMNNLGKRMDVWFNSHALSSNNM